MSYTKAAATGRFGAKPFEPAEANARALLADIREHLPEVAYFQREDLLHLPCWQSVATITAYKKLCDAVNLLLRQRKLVAKGRYDLCLPEKQGQYDSTESLGERYARVVKRLVLAQRDAFGVMDVVRAWKMDQHLTENTKRIAVRGALHHMVRDKLLVQDGYLYERRDA